MIDPGTAALVSSLVAAGGNIASGFFRGGTEGLDQAQQAWLADWQWKMGNRQQDFAESNAAFARDLALNGLAYKAQDARNAGLHPLAALGAAGPSFSAGSPSIHIGGYGPGSKENNWPEALSRAGQNLSRAMMVTRSRLEARQLEADTRKAEAEADFAQTQAIAAKRRLDNPTSGTPGMPDPYGSPSGVRAPMHQWLQGPDGPELVGSKEYTYGVMGKPLTMYGRDFWDIMTGPAIRKAVGMLGWQASDLMRRMPSPGVSGYRQFKRYWKGGR